jgi:hypothetical protein
MSMVREVSHKSMGSVNTRTRTWTWTMDMIVTCRSLHCLKNSMFIRLSASLLQNKGRRFLIASLLRIWGSKWSHRFNRLNLDDRWPPLMTWNTGGNVALFFDYSYLLYYNKCIFNLFFYIYKRCTSRVVLFSWSTKYSMKGIMTTSTDIIEREKRTVLLLCRTARSAKSVGLSSDRSGCIEGSPYGVSWIFPDCM